MKLSRQLLELQETERRHLALELHDDIGQLLTYLRFQLQPIGDEGADAVNIRLAGARAIVDELLGKIRGLSFDLRPAELDYGGLLPAVLGLSERFTSQTRVRVDLRSQGVDRRFAPEVETCAYRIAQEALTNVARHAGVTGVTIWIRAEAGNLSLQIEDRGRGFDPDATLKAGRSSGLAGMRERAQLIGGALSIESAPGAGTTVTAELPLGDPPSAA